MRTGLRKALVTPHLLYLIVTAAVSVSTPASAITATWDGSGINSNWSTPQNWTGSGPGANADLVFPNGAARKTNNNNLGPGFNVSSLTFTGGGYSISGDLILLGVSGSGGINANIPSGNFVFDLDIGLGKSQSFINAGAGQLVLGGNINLGGNALTVSGSGPSLFNGDVTGTGSLIKQGSGPLFLQVNAANFGTTTLAAGSMSVSGAIGNLVFTGGTLAGSASIGNINASAGSAKTIAPGELPGGMPLGHLTAGAVTLSPAVTMAIELDSSAAFHDKLNTTSINLNGASLAPTVTAPPPNGTLYTIITGAVTGQFAQGGSVTIGGRPFAIRYNLNNVTLTAPSTRTWSGGSPSDSWMTAANWVGGVAPIAGDDLVFPDAAARTSNVNNFPAGTQFGSITVTGKNYTFSGNAISVRAGMSFNVATGGTSTFVNLPVTLASAQNVVNNGAQIVVFNSAITIGGTLTFDGTGPGNVAVNGPLSGAGGIVHAGTFGVFLSDADNNYSGLTEVHAGATLALNANGAAGASTAGNGTIVRVDGFLVVNGNSSHIEPVTFEGGKLFSNICAVGCSLTGPVTLAADLDIQIAGRLTLGAVGQSGGARSIRFIGSNGTTIMTGNSTYTGLSTLLPGTTVIVNGTIGNVFLSATAALSPRIGGTGTVGSISGSGIVAPGASAGILNAAGNVALGTNSALAIEIGGTAAGTQYDRLNVTGTVDLNGATLQGSLINGFAPAPADTFTIVQSTGAITGQLAQGASVTFNGVTFNITYNANSVVLTPVATPPLPDLTVTKTHAGKFTLGQAGATFAVNVTNSGVGTKAAATAVSVTESPPAGLTLTAMSGSGWTCAMPTCTRSDLLGGFQSYPPITVTVSVAADAASPQVNSVAVTMSGPEASTANNIASDSVVIGFPLTVSKAGSGSGNVIGNDGAISCGVVCQAPYGNGESVTLTAVSNAGSVFVGWQGACTGTGNCALTITGPTSVTATFTSAGNGRILDIDQDGEVDALTDGLMVIRYLSGLTGTALTNGVIGIAATRTDPAQILAYLNDIRQVLDVDGNGTADAPTDGLLILRNLFQLTGNPLTQGALGPGATRTTDTDVRAYLSTLK